MLYALIVMQKAERQNISRRKADMSRTFVDSSMASITEMDRLEVVSRRAMILKALREHLPFDALEQAVQSFVNAGGLSKGAQIYQMLKRSSDNVSFLF